MSSELASLIEATRESTVLSLLQFLVCISLATRRARSRIR